MSGPYKWLAQGLLAKLGVTYGEDSVPTGDDNAILKGEVTVTAFAATEIQRKIVMPWYGSAGKILVAPYVTLDFSTELAGGGTPLGTAPAWGVLARGCGLAETLTATTKAEYDPITGSEEWDDFYFYLSNNLHKGLGGRGTFKIDLPANDIPTIDWTFTSLFTMPTEEDTIPDLDVAGWKVPVPANTANTTTFTIGTYACVANSFSYDHGNDVEFISRIGRESVEIVDRKASGQIVIENPSVADMNFFADANNRTRRALHILHGTASGNKVLIDSPGVEVGAPAYSNDKGTVMMTLPLDFPYATGNDEIKITCI